MTPTPPKACHAVEVCSLPHRVSPFPLLHGRPPTRSSPHLSSPPLRPMQEKRSWRSWPLLTTATLRSLAIWRKALRYTAKGTSRAAWGPCWLQHSCSKLHLQIHFSLERVQLYTKRLFLKSTGPLRPQASYYSTAANTELIWEVSQAEVGHPSKQTHKVISTT